MLRHISIVFRSTLIHLVNFGPLWSISVYLLKNEKMHVWAESSYFKSKFIKKYRSQTHSKFY